MLRPMAGTREQIIAATLSLVADRGVSATSVDDIAAAAGVAKGSVFYNFGTKQALVETILAEGVARLTAQLKAAAAGRTGREALEALVEELLRRIRENPAFAKLAVAELFRTGRDWQSSIADARDGTIGTFAEVVRQAWPDRDPSLVGAALFGATVVTGLEWLVFEPERTEQEVRAAVLAALA